MTFVQSDEKEKQRQKEEEAIQAIQEKKRKDLEDQIKKRSQDAKNHKPVQNLEIPAQQAQMPVPPIDFINNLLFIIASKNYPTLENIKDIDPKMLDITPAALNEVVNLITKGVEEQYKIEGKEFNDIEQTRFANRIFGTIRELEIFTFITLINNTEQGIQVKINPKALAYINAIGYLVPPQDFRQQYAVYHSLCLT